MSYKTERNFFYISTIAMWGLLFYLIITQDGRVSFIKDKNKEIEDLKLYIEDYITNNALSKSELKQEIMPSCFMGEPTWTVNKKH